MVKASIILDIFFLQFELSITFLFTTSILRILFGAFACWFIWVRMELWSEKWKVHCLDKRVLVWLTSLFMNLFPNFSTEYLNVWIMVIVCLLGFLIIFKAYMNFCLGKLAHIILCLWFHLDLSYTILPNHPRWRSSLNDYASNYLCAYVYVVSMGLIMCPHLFACLNLYT